MTRTIITTGAGGVGKTTLAASIAIDSARAGHRTIVLTIDPAKRLADALGLETLGNEATAVEGEPHLSAAMLDVTASWEDIIHNYAEPEVASRLLVNPYFRAIADRFPAAQAYAAGERMAALVESNLFDVVVVDTPPSAGGIDFFRAPAGTRELVSGRLLKWLTGSHLPGRSMLYRVTARPMLRLADTVLGGPMLSDVADFLLDLRTMYDEITTRSKAIERHLRESEVIVVTTADPTPLHETDRFFDELASVSVAPGCVVFNQTLPQRWIKAADDDTNVDVPTPIRRNLERWAAEARRQRDAIDELHDRLATDILQIDWMVPPPADLDELHALIDGTDLQTWLRAPEDGGQRTED